MLETKIEELNAKLDKTVAALEALTIAVLSQPHMATAPKSKSAPKKAVKKEPEVEAPTAEPETAPVVETEQTQKGDDTITLESLQELCTTIVRADRSKRDTVKAEIAKFDGSKTLKQVDATHYPKLKTALEGLK